MILYKIDKNKIKKIKSTKFSNEKELQTFVENNLEEILESVFIVSEFGARFSIDTVGFDEKTSSPVIIEFKENQSFSVIDQGFTYLNYILTHKGDLQLKINEKFGKNIKVDWSQTKIIFIAKNFNKFQIEATKFKGLPIQLIEYTLYENNIIGFNFVETYQETDLKSISGKNKIMKKVEEEIKQYTLEEVTTGIPVNIKSLFKILREKILEIDKSIDETAGQVKTIYKNNGLSFLYLEPKKKYLQGQLRLEHQENLRNILVNKPVKEDNIFPTLFRIDSEEEIDNVLGFIKKAFESTE